MLVWSQVILQKIPILLLYLGFITVHPKQRTHMFSFMIEDSVQTCGVTGGALMGTAASVTFRGSERFSL